LKDKILALTAIFLICSLFFGILLWVNFNIVPHLPDGESFLVPWMGARSFLLEQANPYTLDAARETQIAIYGHPAGEGEYPYRLDIPLNVLFLYFPFGLIKNFDLARTLWMSFAEIALFAVGFLSINLAGWKTSLVNKIIYFLALFFSFYGLYPLIEGSGAIFVALTLLLILLATREGWDGILGILLAFGALRWQNGGLFFILIIFWLIKSRRWRVFGILAMSLAALLGASFIIIPGWFAPFASSIVANLLAAQGFLFSEIIQIWNPADGNLIANIIKWILLLILFLEWRAARDQDFQRFFWVASLSLAIPPFLNINITPIFYTILFFPLALVFKIAEDRWPRQAKWGIPLVMISLLLSWGFFNRAAYGLQLLTFILPLFLFIALYWLRWWHIHSPRTWVDEISRNYP